MRGAGERVVVGVRKEPRRTAKPAANWSFDFHSIIIFTDTVFYFSSRVPSPSTVSMTCNVAHTFATIMVVYFPSKRTFSEETQAYPPRDVVRTRHGERRWRQEMVGVVQTEGVGTGDAERRRKQARES